MGVDRVVGGGWIGAGEANGFEEEFGQELGLVDRMVGEEVMESVAKVGKGAGGR